MEKLKITKDSIPMDELENEKQSHENILIKMVDLPENKKNYRKSIIYFLLLIF